jgi:hypothetical protein
MIDLTYFEAVGLLAMTPGVVFVAYWKGHANGKREGYIAGRSIMRIPMDTSK